MSQPTTLTAPDILSVKSRVSWGAIAAGAMIALAIYFLLTLLGLAVGLELRTRREGSEYLGIAAGLWAIITLLFSMFIGGWATSRLAVGETQGEAFLYGIILWGVLFVGMIWMAGQGVKVGFGAMMGLASGAVTMTDEDPAGAADRGAVSSLIRRYNDQFGGDKFVDDLTKMGVERDQAQKIRDLAKQKIEAAKNDEAGLPGQIDAAANDPAVRQTAEQAVALTRQALWYTLVGVIVSMLAVVLGALSGSGATIIPVALAGVRRAGPPPSRA